MKTKHLYIFLVSILIFISCKNNELKENGLKKSVFFYSVYKKDTNSWGYKIYENNKLIINQDVVPALNGNLNFKTELSATETAKLVIEKLNKNIFPPSISEEEIRKIIIENEKE